MLIHVAYGLQTPSWMNDSWKQKTLRCEALFERWCSAQDALSCWCWELFSALRFIRQICVCQACLALCAEEGRRSFLYLRVRAQKTNLHELVMRCWPVTFHSIYRGNTFWYSRTNNSHPNPHLCCSHTHTLTHWTLICAAHTHTHTLTHWRTFIHSRKMRSEEPYVPAGHCHSYTTRTLICAAHTHTHTNTLNPHLCCSHTHTHTNTLTDIYPLEKDEEWRTIRPCWTLS